MKSRNILENSSHDQVLVDIPVEVGQETIVVKEKTWIDDISFRMRKFPWIIAAIGGTVIVLVAILSRWYSGSLDRVDIEITTPAGQRTVDPEVTPGIPILESSQGAILADLPYVNSLEGFSIRPPSGWAIDASGDAGAVVIFLNPRTLEIGNTRYATLVNVIAKDAQRILLEDQAVESKKGLLMTYPDFLIEEDLQVFIQGRPYHLIGGVYSVDDVKMKMRTLITIYNNKAYAISGIGPSETWDVNDLAITGSIYSFRPL